MLISCSRGTCLIVQGLRAPNEEEYERMNDPETMTRKCIDGVVTSDTDSTGENVSGFSPSASAYRGTETNQAQVVLVSVIELEVW